MREAAAIPREATPERAGAAAPRAGALRWQRALALAAALLALAGVFMMYLDPRLVVELSQRVWSCF